MEDTRMRYHCHRARASHRRSGDVDRRLWEVARAAQCSRPRFCSQRGCGRLGRPQRFACIRSAEGANFLAEVLAARLGTRFSLAEFLAARLDTRFLAALVAVQFTTRIDTGSLADVLAVSISTRLGRSRSLLRRKGEGSTTISMGIYTAWRGRMAAMLAGQRSAWWRGRASTRQSWGGHACLRRAWRAAGNG